MMVLVVFMGVNMCLFVYRETEWLVDECVRALWLQFGSVFGVM